MGFATDLVLTSMPFHGRFAYDILALIFTRQNNKLS